MRDSFIFYKSFYEGIKEVDLEVQTQIYNAIFKYQFETEEVELNGVAKAIFNLIKPQLKANNKKYENGKKGAEYGVLGGRPKNPEETPKKPQRNPEETPNVNENENVNVNDNKYLVEQIINYMNDLGKTNFKSSTKKTVSLISARLADGFTKEDMKDVIYYCYKEWLEEPKTWNNGRSSESYYRPTTLFNASNFENYLNEYKRLYK